MPWHILSVAVSQAARSRYVGYVKEPLSMFYRIPLPCHAKFVPNNTLICSREGCGLDNLGGGDYDGDLVMISGWDTRLQQAHASFV